MKQWKEKQSEYNALVSDQVGQFNRLYRDMDIPAVIIKED